MAKEIKLFLRNNMIYRWEMDKTSGFLHNITTKLDAL